MTFSVDQAVYPPAVFPVHGKSEPTKSSRVLRKLTQLDEGGFQFARASRIRSFWDKPQAGWTRWDRGLFHSGMGNPLNKSARPFWWRFWTMSKNRQGAELLNFGEKIMKGIPSAGEWKGWNGAKSGTRILDGKGAAQVLTPSLESGDPRGGLS